MDLETALRESIAMVCSVPESEVVPEARLADLGVDSLAAAEVITDVEIRMDIELPMDILRGLTGLRTVGEVVEKVQAQVDRPPAAGTP
jgi:acyl carrier protein